MTLLLRCTGMHGFLSLTVGVQALPVFNSKVLLNTRWLQV